MTVYDHYLSNSEKPGNLIEASRNKAADEWRPNVEMFYPQSGDLATMPDGSWLLRIEFRLKKPYASKAEGEFRPSEADHELQNPIVRDHLTGLPMVRPSTWKGHLAFAARLAGSERRERLFGSPPGEDVAQSGRLHFFPTFFPGKLTREVITPLSRETRTPARGPIDFEVVAAESSGCFHLLYVPRPTATGWVAVADDLEDAARSVKSMLFDYGFSAKKTSGWGVTHDDVQLGKLTAKGTAWPSAAGEQAKPNFVEPISGFLKFMDEFGIPDPRLKKASGEWLSNSEFKSAGAEIGSLNEYKKFRAWHDCNGAEWMRRKSGQEDSAVTALREYSFERIGDLVSLAERLAVTLRKGPDA
jgi:CRISPR-associated protein Cmr2